MRYMTMRLMGIGQRFFAPDNGTGSGGSDSDDAGEGDGPNDNTDEGDDADEKLYTETEVEAAVKKRLAREKRKWQRQQDRTPDSGDDTDSGGKAGKGGNEEDKEKREAIDKASKLEMKLACYEAGVSKDAVDDVATLARAYMANDKDLDLEEAIEKVTKKYPQFAKDSSSPGEDDTKKDKKSWGMRQSGKSGDKQTGVEEAFYARNPGLKQ